MVDIAQAAMTWHVFSPKKLTTMNVGNGLRTACTKIRKICHGGHGPTGLDE
jgi:hypothetical protein